MPGFENTAPRRAASAGRWSKTGLPGPAFALILIAPCLLLSVAVIGYPIFDVIRMSLFDVSRTGVVRDFTGLANFAKAFADPVFLQAARQTLVWTVAVVGGTLLVSVPIALILNEDFYGRTIARTIVLLPWAISLAMTAVVWRYVVNGDFGTLNMTLAALGLPFENYPWLADARMAFLLEILVGILVSVPFTVTILLGGLTSIPESLYEASAIDGASSTKSFYFITMPLLWPFMQIALVLNVIYVFNSFPIIWIMTNGSPANRTDILITYVYKQAFAFGKLGNAAAGSVVMFAMLLVFAVVYLFLTKAQGLATMSKAKKSLVCWALLSPFLVVVLFPYATMLSTSLKQKDEIFTFHRTWLPREFYLGNFAELIFEKGFGRALANSLAISVGATVLSLAVAIPAAYALTRMRVPAKGALTNYLLITQMISPIVLIIGLFRMFAYFGLVNSLLSVIIAHSAFFMAFAVWMLQSYFATIPKDLEEAAWIDGAGRFSAFIRVFLPLCLPGIVVTAIFTFVNSWNEYAMSLTLLRQVSQQTAPVQIAFLTGTLYQIEWHLIMAATLLASVPVAIVFASIQRYLIGGMALGGVK